MNKILFFGKNGKGIHSNVFNFKSMLEKNNFSVTVGNDPFCDLESFDGIVIFCHTLSPDLWWIWRRAFLARKKIFIIKNNHSHCYNENHFSILNIFWGNLKLITKMILEMPSRKLFLKNLLTFLRGYCNTIMDVLDYSDCIIILGECNAKTSLQYQSFLAPIFVMKKDSPDSVLHLLHLFRK